MRRPPPSSRGSRIAVREVRAKDWSNIEALFGPNGACGGCWCMWWRLPRGGRLWEQNKGSPNRRAFKRLIESGSVHGCLAFAGTEPVGWCCIGPRAEFPRLERSRALQTRWDERTWSVVCFFVRSGWRRCGVASALLGEAVRLARRNGARELQAYPVRPKKNDVPPAFAWTGVPALFEKHRFRKVTPPGSPRDIYRRLFRR